MKKKKNKINKCKASAATWNFEYIIKNHEAVTANLLIRMYVKKIENRITCKIKTIYYLELLTPETI